MRLRFLDYSFFLMSRRQRPLDFALVAELKGEADLEALSAGARRAFEAYPVSQCRIHGRDWADDEGTWAIAVIDTTEAELRATLEGLVMQPFALEHERGLRQYLVRTDERQLLVTHMHHAVGDGISLTLWLRAQITGLAEAEPLELKGHDAPRTKSDHAFDKPCHGFAHRGDGPLSPHRRWIDMRFPTVQARWGRLGFSHNDLLCAVLFKSLREWDADLPDASRRRRGLWIPINIRRNPRAGFGNGSSRIRVFDQAGDQPSFAELARDVRAHLRWAIKHGVWNIPERAERLVGYPRWLAKALLWLYAHRPGVDYGTLSFSHVELPSHDPLLFDHFSSMTSIAPLFGRQSLSVTGVGLKGETHLTLTWDASSISDDEAERFAGLIRKNRELAYRSLEEDVPAQLTKESVVGAKA